MYVSVIVDSITAVTAQGLGFASRPHYSTSNNNTSLSDSSTDQCSSSSSGVLPISAVVFPVNAVAPPPVKTNYSRTISRTLLRNKRRTRRKTRSGGDSDDGAEDDGWFFDGSDGPFFGGGRDGGDGGGGRGWNFDRFGGENWDEHSPSGFAFDFVYEVVCWIALSNCVHFAFKKVIRIVAGGIVDSERAKAPMRLTSFKWRLLKKASHVFYLHFVLKKRAFIEEIYEKQEQVKEWLQNLGIGDHNAVVHDDDEAVLLHHDESAKNRDVPSSATLPIIPPAMGRQHSISDRAKSSMQGYLHHFLGNMDIVNSQEVCRFLEVSKLSFCPE